MTRSSDSAHWGPGTGQAAPVTREDVLRNGLMLAAADGRAGTWVVYPFCVSILIMSFKRSSGLQFVPAGSSRVAAGLPYLAVSALVGWWGIPWGILWTIQSIVTCLRGGTDLTPVVDSIRGKLAAGTSSASAAPIRGATAPALMPLSVLEPPATPRPAAADTRAHEDTLRRARTDSEPVARVILRAWSGETPGKEFAESILAAVRGGDASMERNAIAMLVGAQGKFDVPAGVDPMDFVMQQLAYTQALADEVAARLRPAVDGDANGESHVALLFSRAGNGTDDAWATALGAFDHDLGWRDELRRMAP